MELGQLERAAACQHTERGPPEAATAEEHSSLGRRWQRRPVVHRRPAPVGEAQPGVEIVANRGELPDQRLAPLRQRQSLLVELVETVEELVPVGVQLHSATARDRSRRAHERQVDVIGPTTPHSDRHDYLPSGHETKGPASAEATNRRIAATVGAVLIVPPPTDSDRPPRAWRRSGPPPRSPHLPAPTVLRELIGAEPRSNRCQRVFGSSGRRPVGAGLGPGEAPGGVRGRGPGVRAWWRAGRTPPLRGCRAPGTPARHRPATRPQRRPWPRQPAPARGRARRWGWSAVAARTWA